jgi:tetratricopeptide (TPR) repeat protein
MYWTDYNVRDNNEKRKLLHQAIEYLENADRFLRGDWANTCDIGSAHFRMGIANRESGANPDAEFQRALVLFKKVIEDLRPNYGFAFYEMGRIYRVWGHFDDAKASFKKSFEIPVAYRDVGDATVQAELDRAEQSDSNFP